MELCGEEAVRAAGRGRAWSTGLPKPFLRIQGPQSVFLLSSSGDSTPGVSEERNWGRGFPLSWRGFGLRPPVGLVAEPCPVLQGPSWGRASFLGACASLWTLQVFILSPPGVSVSFSPSHRFALYSGNFCKSFFPFVKLYVFCWILKLWKASVLLCSVLYL